MTDGAFWQHSRAILRPQFEKSQVSALDQFEPYVQKLIKCIPADGSTVDLQSLFAKLSMDTSTEFLLETGTDYLGGDKHAEMIDDSINKCIDEGVWREMLGPFYRLLPNRGAEKALRYAQAAVDVWVKQAMEHKDSADSDVKAKDSGKKRYVFINELARHKEVDAVRVRDEALNILLAGKDTTASLLSGLWFALAREPEVYKKLHAEVAELNGERPSYESLRNMKYMKYTVQEGNNARPDYSQNIRNNVTNTSHQSSASTHPPQCSANSPSKIPCSPTAAAPTANNRSSSHAAPNSSTTPTRRCASAPSSAPTPTFSARSAGRTRLCVRAGATFLSAAGPESVWASSMR